MPATTSATNLYHARAEEESRRALKMTPLEIIQYAPGGSAETWLAQEGTVNVFIADKGSALLGQIRQAAQDPGASTRAIIGELTRIGKTPPLSDKDYADAMRKAPVIVEIRHGGATIAVGIVPLAGGDVYAVTSPYNGGKIAAGGLTLVEHSRDGQSSVEAFALIRPPVLTAAEKAAVESVPDDQRELNVPLGWCSESYTGQVAFAVTLAATAATTMLAGCALVAQENLTALTDEKVRALGPAATARELIALRQKFLLKMEEKVVAELR